MLAAVDTYTVLKFFHVLLSVVWVGGAVMVQVLAELTLRSTVPGHVAAFARQVAFVGERIFGPASILVLLLGIWLVHRGHWGFGHFWIVAALVSIAITIVLGLGYLTPQVKQFERLVEAEGPDAPAARAKVRTIVNVARIDTLILLFIIFLMVTKLGQ